jgi:hypothetical protein
MERWRRSVQRNGKVKEKKLGGGKRRVKGMEKS